MKDPHLHDDGDGAEPDLEALLRAAGPRAAPPADVAADVRAAVAAEWRSVVAERRRPPSRRAGPWLAAASVAAVAVVGAWFVAPQLQRGSADVATVAKLTGPVEVRHGAEGAWQALSGTASLRTGDVLRTGPGRLALRRADGLELRLDAGTQLALAAADVARLEAGRVYVDAGRAGSGAGAFEVDTGLGNVRHLGTQYSVGLDQHGLDVAVREGSVAIERGHEPVVARAGERLEVGADGAVTRSAVETHGAAWAWTQSVAPTFAIEGRTLDEFLAWAARESGRQLVYGSADAARLAERTVLKGSVDGLTPEDAVAAVLTTTPSLRHRLAGGQLRLDRANP